MLQKKCESLVSRQVPGYFNETFTRGFSPELPTCTVDNSCPDLHDLTADQRIALMADAMREIFLFCWRPDRGDKGGNLVMRLVLQRFAALTLMINADTVLPETSRTIAARLNISPALLSKIALTFRKTTGIQFRPNRRRLVSRKKSVDPLERPPLSPPAQPAVHNRGNGSYQRGTPTPTSPGR